MEYRLKTEEFATLIKAREEQGLTDKLKQELDWYGDEPPRVPGQEYFLHHYGKCSKERYEAGLAVPISRIIWYGQERAKIKDEEELEIFICFMEGIDDFLIKRQRDKEEQQREQQNRKAKAQANKPKPKPKTRRKGING